jgi:TPR repeat protein/serine/threonine protein kinase
LSEFGHSLGPYLVLSQIGQGGMGAVYRGRHQGSGVEVALKVLKTGAGASPAQRARFRREVEALKQLHHPNLLSVLDAGESRAGSPWLAMPLVPGETLEERLTRYGPLPLDEVWDLGTQLAAALDHVHGRGLIHRDLKPENLIRQVSGGLVRWVVTDFGLAKDLEVQESQALSKTGAIMGTPGYWAPEQAAARASGPATDVYGAGAVLYAALTGSPPISGATFWEAVVATENQAPRPPRELRPETPPALARLVLQCLEKEASARPGDGGELLRALRALDQGAPSRPAGKLKTQLLVLAGALLIGIGAGAGVVILDSSPEDDQAPPSQGTALSPSPAATPTPTPPAPTPPQPTPAEATQATASQLRKRSLALRLGSEGPQDLDAAEALLRQAAETGDHAAISELAQLLILRREPGLEVVGREAQGLEWLRRGVTLGSGRAHRGLGHCYSSGLTTLEQDLERAQAEYSLGAEQGDLPSAYSLLDFQKGPTDRARTLIDQLRRAAEGGDPEGCLRLAMSLQGGYLSGGEPSPGDLSKATEWLRQAAEGGVARAMMGVAARTLAKPSPPKAEVDRAFSLLRRAALTGEPEAVAAYGSILSNSSGHRAPNLELAALWLRRAAHLGDRSGMRDHAISLAEGFGGPPNPQAAIYWARQAASQEDAQAQLMLGTAYSTGKGVDLDRAEGLRWFQRAARLGHPHGLHTVAVAQLTGELYAPPGRALAVLNRLAKRGHGLSNATLGQAYFEGVLVELDHVQARAHYRVAVEKGTREALLPYARMLMEGHGGPRDLAGARAWIQRAISAEVAEAPRALETLEELESSADDQ